MSDSIWTFGPTLFGVIALTAAAVGSTHSPWLALAVLALAGSAWSFAWLVDDSLVDRPYAHALTFTHRLLAGSYGVIVIGLLVVVVFVR